MAAFNPDVKTTNDPNYTKDSRGVDNPRPNMALGQLFSGIGDVVENAVSGFDQSIKAKVKDAVYDGVDPLRDAQGVKDGVVAGLTGNPLNADKGGTVNPLVSQKATTGEEARAPLQSRNPAISQANDSVARLTSAYQAGAIGSTQYFGQLEALTRQLRARFPGYREDVDQMIHAVTGVTPANALRTAIEGDLAANASAQQKAADKFLQYEHSNQGYLPPDYYERKQNGKPYSQLETEAYVGAQKQREQGWSQQKQQLELAHANGTFNKEEGTRTLTANANQIFDATLTKTAEASKFQELLGRVQEMQKSGKTLSPEEQQVLRNQVGSLRLNMQAQLEQLINTPGTSGQSYATMINDPAEIEKVKKGVMARLDNIEQALTNGDFGVLNIETNLAKARENRAYANVMGNDFFANLGAISKVDKALPGIFVTQNPQGFSKAMTGLLTKQAVDRATGKDNGFTNQLTALKFAHEGGRIPPQALKESISSAVAGVTEPQIDREYKLNHAKSLYGDKDMNLLDRFNNADQRTYVFKQMVSPQVTQELLKLKASGGEGAQVWNDYTRWANNSFASTMKGHIDTVTGASNSSDMYTVVWDDKNKALVPQLTPKGEAYVKSPEFLRVRHTNDPVEQFKVLMGGTTYNALQSVNTNMANMKPIWEGNGRDAGQEMSSILRAYDFDPTGKHKPEQTGFLDMLKGMFKGKAEQPEGETEKAIRSTAKPQKQSDLSLDSGGGGGATGQYAGIKDAIAGDESGHNYNRLVDGNGTPKEANLTSMSIADVLKYQKGMRDRGHLSSALGKYQIIEGTLKSLVDQGVVSLNDKYDEATQERLADALIERRGMKEYLAGKMDHRTFLSNLGDEWEAVKRFPRTGAKVFSELDKMARGG